MWGIIFKIGGMPPDVPVRRDVAVMLRRPFSARLLATCSSWSRRLRVASDLRQECSNSLSAKFREASVLRSSSGIARVVGVAAVAGLIGAAPTAQAAAPASAHHHAAARHVLLLSVDGMHQSDLDWYVRQHPVSALAALVRGGVDYTHAQTTFPSDSFPGMVAQLTGGSPATSGVYYDDTFNHALLPAGTTKCAGAKPGAEVDYTEDLDRSKASIDAGQGLSGLPGSILNMTWKPVYPHQYVKVNTVFDVAHAHGLRTAWSDKHPAYEILNGPSGNSIDDLFTPEINSAADSSGDDWTTVNSLT